MKVGVLLNNFGGFPETGRGARACIDLARNAERLGFDSVWVTDHVVLPMDRQTPYPHNASGHFPYTWDQEIFEPLTLMAALATATERVEIGVSVLVIPYRHPLLTAKMIATADQLSGGRILLGAGVGWLRDEFEALGLPSEYYDRRGAVTMDYLRAMQAAWTATNGAAHEGEFVRFEAMGTRPLPARKPHPPVWIGGQGERVLRRTAELGQGYLAISSRPESLMRDTARLRAFCADAARDYDALEIGHIDGLILAEEAMTTEGATLVGPSGDIVRGLERYAASGLTHLIAGVSRAGDHRFESVVDALEEVAAEILPVAHAL
ncbi:MAG: TIGR03619 family F420-dependent LLM class oxidoreductase [Deltaproteobacteria bacterium]|jgi:probable F420-dependent oxidoreductase|nr:TIGR03619 family F420-dependent LLM class oxidoreductase [Deltaproteobacteria bacterium]